MATFGLDGKFVTQFKKELDVEHVRSDQETDFFLLPQLNAIYRFQADALKELVASKLSKSSFGPKPPIEMEIPKGARVTARAASLIGPNYFRPGSVLLPEDRLLYHFIGQEAAGISEALIDRKKVFSNVPLKIKGAGFEPASHQWAKLKVEFESIAKKSDYKFVMRCDITQYFFSLNQHELVNQLEHQGYPPELVKLTERFLSGLTLDRSSRGIVQGVYGSDVLGNGYLTAIDEFISDNGFHHLRYVDDSYIFFKNSDDIRGFFPKFVKRLREYDLSLNENKTFITAPSKLLHEETELDAAINKAKEEAKEKLTEYEEVEVEEYGEPSYIEILEQVPDDKEVELQATYEVFNSLEDFKGEERDRAEAFCLSFFRRAADPVAIPYVIRRWVRHPEKAREYALYLNRFSNDKKQGPLIDKLFVDSASEMIDFQWAWASVILRMFKSVSKELLKVADEIQRDGSRHEVIRSLLTYTVCKHGSAQRKKEVRDNYANAPLLVQLAIIHCVRHFTSGERNALLKTAEAHGELQALMCEAVKQENKPAKKV